MTTEQMSFEPTLAFAWRLDAEDDLASFRKAFVFAEPGLIYLDGNSLGRKVVFKQARKAVLEKTAGRYPAPLAALEAVEHGINYGAQAGLDCEAAHFAELVVGEVSQNLVAIFFASTALKKDRGVEGKAPDSAEVRNMGIVGAGFMGAAIAGVAAVGKGAIGR